MNDEMLITLVETHPEIYDKRHPNYKLHSRKIMIWEHIGQQLDTSADECLRRWTTIREKHGRELRKAEAPSGSGAQYSRPWHLLDSLRFLKQHIVQRAVCCSANVCPEALTSAQPSQIAHALPSPQIPAPVQTSSAPITVPVLSSSSAEVNETVPCVSATVSVPITSPSQQNKSNPSTPEPIASQSRISTSRKRDNTAVANSMCEAIALFKEKVLRVEEEVGNPAVESFGKMITSMVSQMTPLKQNHAMQRMLEVAFQVQQEPE